MAPEQQQLGNDPGEIAPGRTGYSVVDLRGGPFYRQIGREAAVSFVALPAASDGLDVALDPFDDGFDDPYVAGRFPGSAPRLVRAPAPGGRGPNDA